MTEPARVQPVPPETADGDPSPPGAWARAAGWAAFLGVVGGVFYRTTTIVHIACALGLLAVLHAAWRGRFPRGEGWARGPLLAFFLTALFSTLYPPLLAPPETEILDASLHGFWNTVESLVLALLCLLLLRTRRDVATLLHFVVLVVLVLCVLAPARFWLTGASGPFVRFDGLKGNPFTYSTTLYLLAFPVWALLFAPSLRTIALPAWARRGGYLIAAVLPLPILNRIPEAAEAGWLPGENVPAGTGSFVLLAILGALLGVGAWRGFQWRQGRGLLVGLAGAVLFLNVAYTGTRTTVLLAALAVAGMLFVRRRPARRTLILAAAVLALGVGALAIHPRTRRGTSLLARLYIWEGAVGVIRDHFPLGVGYGTRAFRASWIEHRPDPHRYDLPDRPEIDPQDLRAATHAHNLWLHVLAEQGLAGLLALHWLWIVAGLRLARAAFPRRDREAGPPVEHLPADPAGAGKTDTDRENRAVPASGRGDEEAGEQGGAAGLGTVVRSSLLMAVLLVPHGMMEYPLSRSSERLIWLVFGLGVAAAHVAERRRAFGAGEDEGTDAEEETQARDGTAHGGAGWRDFRYHVGLAALVVLSMLVRLLPRRCLLGLGDALGRLGFLLARKDRARTLDHLALALPERDPADRKRVGRQVFANLARGALEMLGLRGGGGEDLFRRIEGVDAIAAIRRRLDEGERFVFVTGHLGQWELLAMAGARFGVPVRPLARPMRHPALDRFLRGIRLRHGVDQLDTDGSPRTILRAVRDGEPVAFLADQDLADVDGVFVDFFGRSAYTPVAPSSLAARSGAGVMVVALVREGRGFRFLCEGPFRAEAGKDRAESIRTLTQAWTAALEGLIRRYPAQWAWMHRRWRSTPDRVARTRARGRRRAKA